MNRIFCIGVVLAVFTAGAFGDTVVYNTTLASPNDPPTSGWYFNSTGQGGFVVDTGGTTHGSNPPGPIETGLRVETGGGIVTPTSVASSPAVFDVYTVAAGSAWNFDFSYDVRPNQTYSLHLSNVTLGMTITDPSNIVSTVNPITAWTDQQAANNSSEGHDPFYKNGVAQTSTDTGLQDSKPLTSALLSDGYNINTPGTYTFNITVMQNTTLLSTDTMVVNVVATPLPSSAKMGFGTFLAAALASLLGGKFIRPAKAV